MKIFISYANWQAKEYLIWVLCRQINDLAQDCGKSTANALELPQLKLSIWACYNGPLQYHLHMTHLLGVIDVHPIMVQHKQLHVATAWCKLDLTDPTTVGRNSPKNKDCLLISINQMQGA